MTNQPPFFAPPAPPAPTACVLLIGNEILSGRTQDCNLAFIAKSLRPRGIAVCEARVIPDKEEIIIATLNEVRARYDLIFTTGGIGPTHDDITAACIAKAFGVSLVRDQEALNHLAAYYKSLNHSMNAIRARMADIPKGATLLLNPLTGAPGFKMENVYVLPGVPRIMQAIFHEFAESLPRSAPILMRTVTLKARESIIADAIALIQKEHTEVDIGSYPFMHEDEPHVSLVAKSTNKGSIDHVIDAFIALAKQLGISPEVTDN